MTDQPELPNGRSPLDADAAAPDEVSNLAMALVMMWGPSMRLPPSMRLQVFVTGLDGASADAYVAEAERACSLGNAYVYDRSPSAGDAAVMAPFEDMAAAVLAAHPWVDEENLDHCYSQACYYTWHG